MINLLPVAIPEHIPLAHPDGIALRRARASDAVQLARAVAESKAHLLPWMPWAKGDESSDPGFQTQRLTEGEAAWARGEEFNFVLVSHHAEAGHGERGNPEPGVSLRDGTTAGAGTAGIRVLGACGLMTRRGPRTLEIGYWTHVAAGGRGYARALAKSLTDVAVRVPGVDEVFIVCDAANVRSAAIPRALGYVLRSVRSRELTAPGEAGQEMEWVMPAGGR